MLITGRLVALAALAVPLALVAPDLGLGLAWLGLVVVVAVLDAALACSPRRLEVSRRVAASVRLSESTACDVLLTNPTDRRLVLLVRDGWVPSAGASGERHRVVLPAGESRRVTTRLHPSRRGSLAAAGLTVRSSGPLGLAARQANLAADAHLQVLPEFASRRHLPSRLARLREMDGRAAVQTRGEGTEFDSLREYVVGDDVRSIDWRATARRQDVVVRTWRPERDRHVLILLDTGRTSAVRAEDGTRLDAGIEAALLLAALADRAGDRVDVAAYDRAPRARVTGTTGARLLPTVAEALSDVTPALVETSWSGMVALAHELVPQRALVVLVSALDPAAVAEGLLPVAAGLTARHTVVLASVTPEEAASDAPTTGASPADAGTQAGVPRWDAPDAYDLAARERLRLDRDAAADALAQDGVVVVQAGASQIAPRLADAYLDLKAAGRL